MPRRRPVTSILALLAAAPFGCAVSTQTDDPDVASGTEAITVCAGHDVVKGIDVSHWKGNIDWHKVRGDGIRFAFAKATQGTWMVDSTFAKNWKGMKDNGIIRGAFHYIDDTASGAQQADYFLHHVSFADGDFAPMLDVEASHVSGELVGDWVDRIKEKTGREPIIYTAGWCWNDKHHTDRFSVNPLFVASWDVSCPVLPHPWKHWAFWQFGGTDVAGIATSVDSDLWNGTLGELQDFAGGSTSGGGSDGVGSTAHAIAAASNRFGNIEIFAVADDGTLHHRWRTGDESTWSDWHSLGTAGGGFTMAPAAASDLDGRIEVVDVAKDGTLRLAFQSTDGSWSDFYSLGHVAAGFSGQPRLVANHDGRLEVFARDKSDAIWHASQTHPGGSWNTLASIGKPGPGTASTPTVIEDGVGRLVAVACGTDGKLYEAHQATAGGTWSSFLSIGKPGGGCVNAPALLTNDDGELELWSDDVGGPLWHTQSSAGAAWSTFARIDAPHDVSVWRPAVARNQYGQPEVFLRGDDGAMWHVWRHSSGAWSDFAKFDRDGYVGTPLAMNRSDGRLEVFTRAATGHVWGVHKYADGSWHDEKDLGSPD